MMDQSQVLNQKKGQHKGNTGDAKLVVNIAIEHKMFQFHSSGQIIATSHDLTPNGGLVREIPLFHGNLGW